MLECTHLIRALSFVQVAAACEAWARADHGVEEEATYSSERSPFFLGSISVSIPWAPPEYILL